MVVLTDLVARAAAADDLDEGEHSALPTPAAAPMAWWNGNFQHRGRAASMTMLSSDTHFLLKLSSIALVHVNIEPHIVAVPLLAEKMTWTVREREREHA
jgi:hypothetical protein